jgi:hypothetical protein
MRRAFRMVSTTSALTLALALGAGCSSSDKKAINETVARNAVAVGAKKEFHTRGHSLDGLPTCRTASKTTTSVNVICTGKTDKGEPIGLAGTTNDARAVKGHFVGTLAGRDLFTTTCLGC